MAIDPKVIGSGLSILTDAQKTPQGIIDYYMPWINSTTTLANLQSQLAAKYPNPITQQNILNDALKYAKTGTTAPITNTYASLINNTLLPQLKGYAPADTLPGNFNYVIAALNTPGAKQLYGNQDWYKNIASYNADGSLKATDYDWAKVLKSIPTDALLSATDYANRVLRPVQGANLMGPLAGVLQVLGAGLGFQGLSNAIASGAASMTPGELLSSAIDKIGNIGSSIGSAVAHPIDTLGNILSTAGDVLSHPIDSITNGILGTQSPAPIVDHSVGAGAVSNIGNAVPGLSTGVTTPAGGAAIVGSGSAAPLQGIGGAYAGGAANLADYASQIANSGTAISGASGLGTSPVAVAGGATPATGVLGLPSGNIPGTTTNVGQAADQAASSNIYVPSQAANSTTNALSNVVQNLAGNAITSALTDTPTASSGALGGGVNPWKPGLLGVNYPGLKSASPFYKGKIGLLGSYV